MVFESKVVGNVEKKLNSDYKKLCWLHPRGPIHIFNDRQEGGGGASDFFGSEILAKSAFLGSMNNAGIFFGSPKNIEGFFGVLKKGLRDFLAYAKKSSDFFG